MEQEPESGIEPVRSLEEAYAATFHALAEAQLRF
jgi:hypothetical protein